MLTTRHLLYHNPISIRVILSGINEFDRNETTFSFYVYLERIGAGFNQSLLKQLFLQEYLRYYDAKIHR